MVNVNVRRHILKRNGNLEIEQGQFALSLNMPIVLRQYWKILIMVVACAHLDVTTLVRKQAIEL